MSDFDFEKHFGCTYAEYTACIRDDLMRLLRGDKKAARGNQREKVAKMLLDLVRNNPTLCDQILFELERGDVESDFHFQYRLRHAGRRSSPQAGRQP